jgi:hypothetical protein
MKFHILNLIQKIDRWIEIFPTLSPERQQYVLGLCAGIAEASSDEFIKEVFANLKEILQTLTKK